MAARAVRNYLTDMDGVLISRSTMILGPLMMRTALNYRDVHSEDTVMIGDRMDTDIVAGVESGMDTVLVLSGVTEREDVGRYPYQPTRIVASVGEIEL